jgi:hypothetical protein
MKHKLWLRWSQANQYCSVFILVLTLLQPLLWQFQDVPVT